jgi:hypothetical protein
VLNEETATKKPLLRNLLHRTSWTAVIGLPNTAGQLVTWEHKEDWLLGFQVSQNTLTNSSSKILRKTNKNSGKTRKIQPKTAQTTSY